MSKELFNNVGSIVWYYLIFLLLVLASFFTPSLYLMHFKCIHKVVTRTIWSLIVNPTTLFEALFTQPHYLISHRFHLLFFLSGRVISLHLHLEREIINKTLKENTTSDDWRTEFANLNNQKKNTVNWNWKCGKIKFWECPKNIGEE